jgi:hypothetical protein
MLRRDKTKDGEIGLKLFGFVKANLVFLPDLYIFADY